MWLKENKDIWERQSAKFWLLNATNLIEMKVKYSRSRHNAKQTNFTSPTGARRQCGEQEHAQYCTNHDVTSGWICRRPENVSLLSSLIASANPSGKTISVTQNLLFWCWPFRSKDRIQLEWLLATSRAGVSRIATRFTKYALEHEFHDHNKFSCDVES